MRKKGSIVGNKVVNILLILISVIILIVVFTSISWSDEINREACHQSVIYRGTLPDTFDLKNLPSLNCETRYVCITDKLFGSADCESIIGNYQTVRITSDAKKQDEEINKFLARELADCWSMMGEGKLQIFTRDFATKKRCSVCSVIAFDKDLKSEKDQISGLAEYLTSKQVPETDVSYAKFLRLDQNDLKSFSGLTLTTKAILFFEIGKSDAVENIGTGVGVFAGGALGFFTKSFTVAKIAIPIGGVVGHYAGGEIQDYINEDVNYVSGNRLIDYDEKTIQSLECKPF